MKCEYSKKYAANGPILFALYINNFLLISIGVTLLQSLYGEHIYIYIQGVLILCAQKLTTYKIIIGEHYGVILFVKFWLL